MQSSSNPITIVRSKTGKTLSEAEIEQAARRLGAVYNPLYLHSSVTPYTHPQSSPYFSSLTTQESITLVNQWGSGGSEEDIPATFQNPSPPLTPLVVSRQEPEKLPVINKTFSLVPAETSALIKKPAGNIFSLFGCCNCESSDDEPSSFLRIKTP